MSTCAIVGTVLLAPAGMAGAPPGADRTEPAAQAQDSGKGGEQHAVAVDAAATRPAASAATGGSVRSWGVMGRAEYRSLAVVDEDPKNDAWLRYAVTGTAEIVDGVTALATVEMLQGFYPEPDESVFLLQDLVLGAQLQHSVTLEGIRPGLPGVSLMHQALLILPSSRSSLARDLIVAPTWRSMAWMDVSQGLGFGIDATVQYLAYRYAESPGLPGEMNKMLVGGGRLFVEYVPLDSEVWGQLRLGVDGHLTWSVDYPHRDDYVSDLSDRVYWRQLYGWDVYVSYAPLAHLTVSAAIAQGGPIRADGIIRPYLVKREETQLILSVTGTLPRTPIGLTDRTGGGRTGKKDARSDLPADTY